MAELNLVEACPKCGYVRKPTDTAPSWQCPSCGIVYAKFGAKSEGHADNLQAHESLEEGVVISYSRIRLILWLALDIAFVVALVFLHKEGRFENRFELWTGLALFSVAIPFFVALLLRRKPALIIDHKGITNNTLLYTSDYIPWSAYAREEEIDIRSKGTIVARNVIVYVNQSRAGTSTATKGTFIQTFCLSMGADEIQAHIDRFHRAYLRLAGTSTATATESTGVYVR